METTSMMMEGGEWTSFNKVSINEEADFMANLFSNSSYSDDPEMSCLSMSSSFYSGQSHEHNNAMFGGENTSFYTTDSDSNLYSLAQGTSLSGSSESVAYQCHENYCLSDTTDEHFWVNGKSLPIEFCLDTKGVVQGFPGNPIERNHSLNLEMSYDNLDESEMGLQQSEHSLVNSRNEISEIIEPSEEGKCIGSSEAGRKRSRNSEAQKGKRNTRSKRSRKIVSDNDDNSPALINQNTGSCISEDELSGENSKLPTKTRASRGSATDPQSLYARKRRERINERLRTLQGIVPNGTKVDLSTMLEEAVSYVKFLQLQIKLLSSDDLWMYAPLAYNGMDIGLDAKLNSLL